MRNIEKELKAIQAKAKLASKKPTIKELRKQKNPLVRLNDVLNHTVTSIFEFNLFDFCEDKKVLHSIIDYFFDAYEYETIEIPVDSEDIDKDQITKEEGNVVFVDFKKDNNQNQ